MNKLHYVLPLLLICAVSHAGIISHSDYTTGSVITAAGQNANENTIVNEFNGNINSANIAALGIVNSNIANNTIDVAKITSGSNNSGQVLLSTTSGVVAQWSYHGQVVQSTMCTTSASSATVSTTFVSTGFTCSITPRSSTSFVKVTIRGSFLGTSDFTNSYFTAFRNTTNLGGSNGFVAWRKFDVAANVSQPRSSMAIDYLDSPATTSAISYGVYFRNDSGSNITWTDVGTTSVMILEEYGN